MEQFITSYVIESIISTAIFYLLFLFFLKNNTNYQFNRFYLITAAVLSTLIPLINLHSKSIEASFQELNLFSYSNFVPRNIFDNDLSTNLTTAQTSTSSFQIIDIVIGVYILFAFFIWLRILIGLVRLFNIYRKNPVQKKEHYSIVYFEKDYSPFSFFKYIFINHRYNNEEYFDTIIEHEKVHVFEKHSIDIILLEIISIIQWYNPFIWLIKNSIKEIHEFQADEKVIAQGFDSNSYFTFLLNKIVGIQAMDFANCFNKSLIKKRIMMMEKSKSRKTRLYKSLLVIPIALFLLAFTIDFNSDYKLGNEPNLSDYQTTTEDEIPEGWIKSVKYPSHYTITTEESEDGEKYIVMVSNETIEREFGNLMQTFSAKNYINKRISFSGKIKTENAIDGAAFWMRVDGSDKTKSLAFDNMHNRKPTGTTDWKYYNIVLDVPEGAEFINIGMMLIQEGKAWFSNLNFEEVDNDTPLTAGYSMDVPEKPINLDLNK